MRGATKKNSVHYEFANYFLGFGAKWLDKDFKPIMNSDDGVAALQYFVDLKNRYKVVPPDASAVGYLEKNQYFQTGKIAQTVQWSAAFKALFSAERSPKVLLSHAMATVRQFELPDVSSIKRFILPGAAVLVIVGCAAFFRFYRLRK